MSPKSFFLPDDVQRYLVAHSNALDEVQRDLIEETAALGAWSGMQISPEQGVFMELLVRLMGARHAVEVGVFTGFSTLCLARGVGDGGSVLACDVNEEWTAIGRRYWERAGVADRVGLVLGPAAGTLRALPLDEQFDVAFIDADKGSYPVYYEEILTRLCPNGVIMVDNVLWGGSVVRADAADDDTAAIRAFNDLVVADPRVDVVMLAVADGLTLIRKR